MKALPPAPVRRQSVIPQSNTPRLAINERPRSPRNRIAIFCPLDSLSPAYSLSEVIIEQAKMLALAGYSVEVWTVNGYQPQTEPQAKALVSEYPKISLRPCIPRVITYDYQDITKPPDASVTPYDYDTNPSFEGKVQEIVKGLLGPASQVEFVFAHDLLFQTAYLAHGLACRRLADQLPQLKWIHWQHSGPQLSLPDPMPGWPHYSRFAGMSNSRFLYVNDTTYDRQLVARNRGIKESELAFVPNTRDIMEYFEFSPETKDYVRQNDLLSADILIVVPARLNEGKQPKKAMMVTKAFRDCGKDARCVWVSGYSPLDQDEHRNYLAVLRQFGRDIELPESAFLVTGEYKSGVWRLYTPRRVVRELQLLADLFVLPSLSEAHSLVTMEAALCRNTLILNEDFKPMEDWYPRGASVNWHFGSLRVEQLTYIKPGDPDADPIECEVSYYRGRAWALLDELSHNHAWLAFNFQKRERNLQSVFRRYVAPIMHSLANQANGS